MDCRDVRSYIDVMMNGKTWIAIGALSAGIAVVMGAFGAHGLDKYVVDKYGTTEVKSVAGWDVPMSWKRLEDFKTGAEYQMYHGLALIAAGWVVKRTRKSLPQVAAWCFLLGTVFFSGSLYVLTLTGQTYWGAIAPIGGTLLIVGWVALAIGATSLPANTASDQIPA